METDNEDNRKELSEIEADVNKNLSKKSSGEKSIDKQMEIENPGEKASQKKGDNKKVNEKSPEEGEEDGEDDGEVSHDDIEENNKEEARNPEDGKDERMSSSKNSGVLEKGADGSRGNSFENLESKNEASKRTINNIEESNKNIQSRQNQEEEKQKDENNIEKVHSEKSLQEFLGQQQKLDGEFNNKDHSSRIALSKTSQSDKKAEDLAKILSQVKKARIQIETDAKVLANRVSLLQQEELRTLKKIKETRTKADEIYRMKKDNKIKSKLKSDDLEQAKEMLRNSQKNTLDVRKQRKEHQVAIMQAYMTHKKDEMNAIKKESDVLRSKRSELVEQFKLEKLSKTHYIKKGLILGNLRIQEFNKTKLASVKSEYMARIDQEKDASKFKENEVLQMEKLELELIKNLQQTQALQKNTYDELEDALNLPLGEYEEKYNKNIEIRRETENAGGGEDAARGVSVKKKKKKKKKKKTVVEVKHKVGWRDPNTQD